ncbi:hypothetical protein Pmani_026008 [Petrolisthes manimaculis]|uniref:Uncharacterized protein n=1 Tax=Petrolisthes manimaculis TaxID=1843537 RepID=A0AAE1U0K5_9EUCA|nr:hypothetical protein Pmani_026008 [Petrolisthes manimaculis]
MRLGDRGPGDRRRVGDIRPRIRRMRVDDIEPGGRRRGRGTVDRQQEGQYNTDRRQQERQVNEIKDITSTPLYCVKTNVKIRQQLIENYPTSQFAHFKLSRRQVPALRDNHGFIITELTSSDRWSHAVMSQVPLTEAGHTYCCCCCCSLPGHSRTHSLSRASLSKCQLGLMVPSEASRGDDVFGFHICWSG